MPRFSLQTKFAFAFCVLIFSFKVWGEALPLPQGATGTTGAAASGDVASESAIEAQMANLSTNLAALKMQATATTVPPVGAGCMPFYAKAVALYGEMEKCQKSQAMAGMACMESSPQIMTATTVISSLLTISSTVGLMDACKMYKSGMDKVKIAMQAYSTICGGLRYNAKADCDIAKAGLAQLSAAVGTCPLPASSSFSAAATTAHSTIEAKIGQYSVLLANAGMGLIQLAQRSSIAKQCLDNTAAPEIDCSKTENLQVQKCICEKAPRTYGCSQTPSSEPLYGGAAPQTTDLGNSNSTGSPTIGGGGGNLDSSGNRASSGVATSGGGSAAGGAAAGGAAAGGAAAGGAGKGADGSKGSSATKSGFNANILQGEMGGGGGGGGAGGRGSSVAAPDYSSKYGQYLPGGKADPSRNPAASAKMEITGGGGEDNFQKVSDRYRDAKPTLMGH